MEVISRKGPRKRRDSRARPRYELVKNGRGWVEKTDRGIVRHAASRSVREQRYLYRLVDHWLGRSVAYYANKRLADRDLQRRGLPVTKARRKEIRNGLKG